MPVFAFYNVSPNFSVLSESNHSKALQFFNHVVSAHCSYVIAFVQEVMKIVWLARVSMNFQKKR